MPVINVTLPSDGSTADANDYNSVITTMLATINGLLDDDNIASMSGTKITAGTLPATAVSPDARKGWETGQLSAPNTVTYNGQRSYSLVFNSNDITDEVSPGMRIRTTRTVVAPTQCTNLNGTTQYYSKSSPNKMTFTDDFVVSVWVKLTSYATSAVISRFNGTSGWSLQLQSTGQVQLVGYNAGSGNSSLVTSYQSVPLNKWVHITVQLDMSTFTAAPTTSYIMLDGVDSPATVSRFGTNPTALVQAGNLEIGSQNAGLLPFPGKIAQAAVWNSKVTQATMRGYISQGLTGSETSLASAYSFSNSITDLNTTTPNDLTANGSAVATTTDSPFGTQADGSISSTLDYGIIMSTVFSTNTTIVVQVPEGDAIPTIGGVSAIAYSSYKAPYGFPSQADKWYLNTLWRMGGGNPVTSNATYGSFQGGNYYLNVPIGAWIVGQRGQYYNGTTTAVTFNLSSVSLTGLATGAGYNASPLAIRTQSPSAATTFTYATIEQIISLSTATIYRMYTIGGTTGAGLESDNALSEIYAENAYL